jgi:quercetin dioxygenase-like cupin family protein
MGYSASPRPTFERASAIPYDTVTRHLWGDKDSGEVADWIYVSSDKVHSIMFGLSPRGWFRHSRSFRTVFGGDVTYHVLSGVMAMANPETGEVQIAEPGDTVLYRKDTWHHVYNYSDDPLRVVEFFAPPPSTGTSGKYAATRPYLESSRYTRDEWLGRLPMQRAALDAETTLFLIKPKEVVWRLEGGMAGDFPMRVGLITATEHLTVGEIHLLPGQNSCVETHGGDEAIFVKSGTLNIRVHDDQRPNWFELKPGDECYIPQGTPHEYYNITGEPVTALFGVAPHYKPA